MTIYSQRDSRWKNKKLGFSTRTIGTDGCTLTCISMLVGETPDVVNDKLKAVKAFSGALIAWGNIQKAYPQLKFIKRVRNYNNWEVSFWVNLKGKPQLVEVYAGKIGAPRHWVVFIGNKKCIDPWTGLTISTSYYTPLTGYALLEKN